MMNPVKRERFNRWCYVAALIGLIYATLYWVRPLCVFLQSATPFALLINLLGGVLLGGLVLGFLLKAPSKPWSSYLIMIIVLSVYVYGLATIPNPEEKIHFIEYGFLAYLTYRALSVDVKAPTTYFLAYFITTMVGWIDEGIQYLLPNRYYQIGDVLLNSVSAAQALLLIFVFSRKARDFKSIEENI